MLASFYGYYPSNFLIGEGARLLTVGTGHERRTGTERELTSQAGRRLRPILYTQF